MIKIFNSHFLLTKSNAYVLLPTLLITGFMMTIFLILQFIVANADASYQNQIKTQTANLTYYQIENLLIDDPKITSVSLNGFTVTINQQRIEIFSNKKTYQFDRYKNQEEKPTTKK